MDIFFAVFVLGMVITYASWRLWLWERSRWEDVEPLEPGGPAGTDVFKEIRRRHLAKLQEIDDD